MNCKNIEAMVHRLDELRQISYSVCIHFKPGESRREKARFWNFTDTTAGKHCLMARINKKDFVVPENGERNLSQDPYSEEELKKRAENYAGVVRGNLGAYLDPNRQ